MNKYNLEISYAKQDPETEGVFIDYSMSATLICTVDSVEEKLFVVLYRDRYYLYRQKDEQLPSGKITLVSTLLDSQSFLPNRHKKYPRVSDNPDNFILYATELLDKYFNDKNIRLS